MTERELKEEFFKLSLKMFEDNKKLYLDFAEKSSKILDGIQDEKFRDLIMGICNTVIEDIPLIEEQIKTVESAKKFNDFLYMIKDMEGDANE